MISNNESCNHRTEKPLINCWELDDLLYKTAEEKVTFSFDNLKRFQKFNPQIHIRMDMDIFTGASKSWQFSVDVFRVSNTL
jgi:hypothetical protein